MWGAGTGGVLVSGWFAMKRGLHDHPVFKGRPERLGLMVILASKGQSLFVHFDDLVECSSLHPRRLAKELSRLDDAGQISVIGGGGARLILITSDLFRAKGKWVSPRAKWPEYGAYKWRGPALSPKVRAAVFSRDGAACVYCGDAEGPFHIDHIKPVAKGGTDALNNLCVACAKCNLSKGAKSLNEWVGHE